MARRTRKPIIDCDIHNTYTAETLAPYLPAEWRRYQDMFGARGHGGSIYPKGSPNAARLDAWPPSGRPPGGDLGFMQEQLLDPLDIEYGVLNHLSAAATGLNPEFSAALSRAVNDWLVGEWLDPEPRLRGSIVTPYEHGELAAAEVDRVADDPRFVQLIFAVRTAEPLGRRKYWPIYEAAQRHGLPIGIHFGGGARGVPITGSGWPSYYLEDHTGMAQAFQAQVVSYVCEGVFERFPSLQIVLIEGGFAWLPSLARRLDQHWERLQEEVPHLKRRPSEYIRDHFWVTTQPMEEPHRPKDLLRVFEHMGGSDRVLFSTDYPHWDFDHPDRAFQTRVPDEMRAGILAGNARNLYRF